MKKIIKNWVTFLGLASLGAFVATIFPLTAFAAAETLSAVASHVTGTMGNVAKLMTAAAYVAGFGFAIGAILKFKAHKDNPTQIPVGTPIALIFIAAALIFMPTIFGVAGATMFGQGKGQVGGVTGTSTFSY